MEQFTLLIITSKSQLNNRIKQQAAEGDRRSLVHIFVSRLIIKQHHTVIDETRYERNSADTEDMPNQRPRLSQSVEI